MMRSAIQSCILDNVQYDVWSRIFYCKTVRMRIKFLYSVIIVQLSWSEDEDYEFDFSTVVPEILYVEAYSTIPRYTFIQNNIFSRSSEYKSSARIVTRYITISSNLCVTFSVLQYVERIVKNNSRELSEDEHDAAGASSQYLCSHQPQWCSDWWCRGLSWCRSHCSENGL